MTYAYYGRKPRRNGCRLPGKVPFRNLRLVMWYVEAQFAADGRRFWAYPCIEAHWHVTTESSFRPALGWYEKWF